MGKRKGIKNGQTSAVSSICVICGKEYLVILSRVGKSKCCSNKCRGILVSRQHTRPTPKICPICQREFITSPKSRKVYCSHECAMKDHGRKISGDKNCNFVEKISKPCPICGTLIIVSKNDKRRVYCSKKCHNASLITPLVKTVCQVCGKEQYFTPFIASRRKYCSGKCLHNATGKSNTSIEIAVSNGMTASGISFISQYQVDWYTLDFAIPDRKIAIECDGDYWHSLPVSIKRDKAKNSFLTNRGWTIIRLKESDIRSNLKSCIDRISERLAIQP